MKAGRQREQEEKSLHTERLKLREKGHKSRGTPRGGNDHSLIIDAHIFFFFSFFLLYRRAYTRVFTRAGKFRREFKRVGATPRRFSFSPLTYFWVLCVYTYTLQFIVCSSIEVRTASGDCVDVLRDAVTGTEEDEHTHRDRVARPGHALS